MVAQLRAAAFDLGKENAPRAILSQVTNTYFVCERSEIAPKCSQESGRNGTMGHRRSGESRWQTRSRGAQALSLETEKEQVSSSCAQPGGCVRSPVITAT